MGFSIGRKGYVSNGSDSLNMLHREMYEYLDDNQVPHAYSSANVFSAGTIVTDGAWTIDSNKIYNANSGNVGIGTATPASKLEVNGSIRQRVYSQVISLSGNGAAGFTWTHNLGYQPVIMIAKDQTGGSYLDYVEVSYSHIDNNSLTIYYTNRGTNTAAGTLRWIVVY